MNPCLRVSASEMICIVSSGALNSTHSLTHPVLEGRFAAANLDISTAGDLGKMFLALERLVNLVVGHAEHPQSRFCRLVTLAEHDKLWHERNQYRLAIQVGRHPRRLADVLTVHEPKPTQTRANYM